MRAAVGAVRPAAGVGAVIAGVGMVGRSGAATGIVTRSSRHWGWVAAEGVLGLLLGVYALFNPGVAILAAAILLGIGLVVQGAVEIGLAVRAGAGTAGRGWLVTFGVLTLVAGILVVFVPAGGVVFMAYALILLFSPATAAGVIALSIALGFLLRGGADVGLALSMRPTAR